MFEATGKFAYILHSTAKINIKLHYEHYSFCEKFKCLNMTLYDSSS